MLEAFGIDVSKSTIDVHGHNRSAAKKFSNDAKGFLKLVKWIAQDNYFICLENTGYYSLSLVVYLEEQGIPYVMLSPIEIKRSIGLVRGKSDQIDAKQIARYAWLHKEELKGSKLPARAIIELSQLLKLREQFVKQRVALNNMLEAFGQTSISNKPSLQLIKLQVKQLSKHIKKAEAEAAAILKQGQLNQNNELLQGIIGVGPILAAELIVHTNNFTSFSTWRQLACYAGVAPFEHTSGTSIRGRTRVHHIADRKLKQLLNMAAISAIRHDPEVKKYYHKKVEQGKNKMSVINAVRCKILARCFAVIKRQTPYVILQSFAA